MNRPYRKVLFVLLLLLSPLATIAVFGAAYIAFRVAGGLEPSAAVSSFKAIINTLRPYFPYLTIIPVALFMFAQLIGNKTKVHNLRK